MVSFICAYAFGQFGLKSASNISFWAVSPRVGMQAWWGCSHMADSPKTHSHLMARLGTTNKNAISHQGLPASPQALAWERVVNYAFEIMCTWNHITIGQKSSDLHVALVDVSHRPTSVERSKKLLMLSLSVMEEKEPVS